MAAPFYYLVAEEGRRLLNPTSAAKVLELGRVCRLDSDMRVLDMGCGKGEPATLLATTYGCRVVGVDFEPTFLAAARARASQLGVSELCTFEESEGSRYTIEAGGFEMAMALGTSFIYSGFEATVKALATAIEPQGYLAVGEPYWKVTDPPEAYLVSEGLTADRYATLAENLERLKEWGFELVNLIVASREEWDSYEGHHWQAVDRWYRANPTHPRAKEVLRRMHHERESYLRWGRDCLGWAILVMRPAPAEVEGEARSRVA